MKITIDPSLSDGTAIALNSSGRQIASFAIESGAPPEAAREVRVSTADHAKYEKFLTLAAAHR